ncbi:alpha/beta hydrolase-fold protein [uncultured Flavobacterium sp.]|uniref:alpha/beta hydrolase n=1 Tax=uncultured Flavobacterium sp. TaxID=165435 RepID=UPI0025CC6377|nr:alpha/beta hydrolase-fold protein [uncultured Flavobacterium sp.]
MKNTLLTLLSTLVWPLSAQVKVEEFASRKLNATREVSVLTPPSYDADKNRKYPLLFLLDGNYLFDPFSGMLAYTEYWNDLPEVIIVGINQENEEERTLDSQVAEHNGLPFGQSEKFFEFIAYELIPQLEKQYRIAPFRIIAGHNITAGYLNFFLYKDKPVFNAYICMSPELAVDMETHVPEQVAQSKSPLYYYLATADGDLASQKESIKELDTNMKAVTNPNLKYFFNSFSGASHYSLVTRAIPESLYSIFSCYQPISSTEYSEKIVTMTSGYVKYLTDRYDIIEEDLGLNIPIRLNDFKAIEAAILKNGAYDELRDLSDVASKQYPKTTLSDYYKGLYYEKTGDNKKAIKAYMHSYTLEGIGEYTVDFMLEQAEKLKER